jgi:hypothetical protein
MDIQTSGREREIQRVTRRERDMQKEWERKGGKGDTEEDIQTRRERAIQRERNGRKR